MMTHVNIVYPVLATDDDNIELKHTLRSIERNVLQDVSVTIIGHLPEWCVNVRHIPYNDGRFKLLNLRDKIRIAIELYDEFIYMPDDVYINNEVTYGDLKEIYHNGNLLDIPNFGKDPFSQVIKENLKVLIDNDLSTLNHIVHIPRYVISKDLLEVYDKYLVDNRYMSWEIFYYNYKKNNPSTLLTPNIRYGCFVASTHSFDKDVADKARFISINANSDSKEFHNYIRNKFSKPSKYEKRK